MEKDTTPSHNVSYKPLSINTGSATDNKNKQQQDSQQNQEDQQVINIHSSTISKRLSLQILPVTLKHSNKTLQLMPYSTVDETNRLK